MAEIPNQFNLYRNQGVPFKYTMAEPENIYREPMNVTVEFGDLDFTAWYEPLDNSINIDPRNLTLARIGYHKVEVLGSYFELDNSTVTYVSEIYFWVIDGAGDSLRPEDIPTTLPNIETFVEDQSVSFERWYDRGANRNPERFSYTPS